MTNMVGTALIAAAQQFGGTIVRIVRTHAHADHGGSVDALVAALPAVSLIMSTRDARLLRGDTRLDAGEPIDTLRGEYVITTTQPRMLLHDGDVIGALRAIASQGIRQDIWPSWIRATKA